MTLSEKQKDVIFKAFIFGIIEFICVNIYLTISGIAGHLFWSVEQLTTTPEGILIQIITFIMFFDGAAIFIYLVIFLLMYLTT
jgi:hypothetical protein